MARLSALGHVGMAFETTFGTAVAPVVYIPYNTIKVDDNVKKIVDEARRGVLTKDFNVYNAARSGSVQIDTFCYPELLGYFLKPILSNYTTTGSAGAYTHSFQVLNALSPSLTLSDYNSITERQYAGAVMEEVGFKFDTENLFTVSAKYLSKGSAVATQTSPTFNTSDPFTGFQSSLTLNGTQNLNMVGGEISIKRATQMIFAANGTADPSKYSTGRIEVTGKFTFDVEDESEWLMYRNNTRPSVDLTFNRDDNTSIEFHISNADFSKATIDRSGEFLRVDAEFRAFYNVADAGMMTVTLKNNIASY
jgi:hypothetical protein